MKPGDRVIAIASAKDGNFKYYGRGVFAGNFKLPPDVGGFNLGQINPRIDLDNGETVWGCECWWGAEQRVIERFPENEWKWELVKNGD